MPVDRYPLIQKLEGEVAELQRKVKELLEQIEKLEGRNTEFGKQLGFAARTTAQKLKNNLTERIKLDAAGYDPGNNFDLVNGFFTVPATGVYLVLGQIAAPVSKNATIFCAIGVNAVRALVGTQLGAEANAKVFAPVVGGILKLKVGDKVELLGFQNSGEEQALQLSGQEENFLAIARMA